MSDIKLFQINNNKVTELEGNSVSMSKTLQTLFVNHLSEEIKEIDNLVKKVMG
jgi:hypothetical protein